MTNQSLFTQFPERLIHTRLCILTGQIIRYNTCGVFVKWNIKNWQNFGGDFLSQV